MKVQLSPLMGYERHFWACPELVQGILAWSMDPRIQGPDDQFNYIPSVGFTTSQAARNYACDRFLDENECEYLIMIDNDMKPLHPVTNQLVNVVHLPFMGLPIVAAPAPVVKGNKWLINGFYHDYENGWRGMTMEELEQAKYPTITDLGPAVPVDAAGMGCICIRRDVLLAVKEAGIDFLDSSNKVASQTYKGVCVTRYRDQWGKTVFGEDMLFGRRALELGFKSYMAPACIMGHYHTIDQSILTQMQLSFKAPDYRLEGKPHPMPDEYSISVELAQYLRDFIIVKQPRRILELGAGISTLVMADQLSLSGLGETSWVTSLEEDSHQAERINRFLRRNQWGFPDLVEHAQLVDGFYDWAPFVGEEFDLLLVDGPSGQHQSRAKASRLFPYLAVEDAVVVLDDTQRPYEASVVQDWCENHGLKLTKEIISHDGRKSTVMVKTR